MSYTSIVRKYLANLQKEYQAAVMGGQHTVELSYRPVLDTFFRELAKELNGNDSITIILEPKNQARMGRPDWRIHDGKTLGVYGYIEGKGLSNDKLDISPYQEQIDKYLTLGHKLIITDGLDFVFCMDNSEPAVIVSLVNKAELHKKDWSKLTVNSSFEMYMRRFFAEPSPQLCDESRLIELVAIRTRLLSNELLKYASLPIEEAYEDEREAIEIISELRDLVYAHNDGNLRNNKVFADFVAQLIMFCLLYAHRVICETSDSPLEKERKIKEFLNEDSIDDCELKPFKRLLSFLMKNADEKSFIILWTKECIEFLSFVQMTDKQILNPDYHKLFESFLSKFDPQSRFDYGAYYTPKELAEFIVVLTEQIVNKSFNGASIFDEGNTIIDPCCGTGSFLEQIVLHDTKDKKYNLCGFEILPAPYMLANYRMAILRNKYGVRKHKTHIVLANTLSNYTFGEEVDTSTIQGEELKKAQVLSSLPLKLIIGNPPSSDSSKTNEGPEFSIISDLLADFRPPEEMRHGRQNIQKQINNPHMQFLRWACEKLVNSSQHSVLSFIVPSSFLEAESYRYARKYLCENFSEAWIVAIDADARTGIRSDSLFNTLQGRAVIIAVRRHNESNSINRYMYLECSSLSKSEKLKFLQQPICKIMSCFVEYAVNSETFAFCPSKPFDEDFYDLFWPVSGEADQKAIFINHCSGIKLAPTSLFTHVKTPFLKRRTRDIAQNGVECANEWFAGQQKAPTEDKIKYFQYALNEIGDASRLEKLMNEKIFKYSFRPFLTSNVILWDDLLRRYARVGGGGTRLRPEIIQAYNNENTIGFAMAHAPKDLDSSLKQFVSFCWYYPDNDMCTRGNSHIYLNQYPEKTTDGVVMRNNIETNLTKHVSTLLEVSETEAAKKIVFYTYAILCSQRYLDAFEGALFTVHRSDKRARVPVVDDAETFGTLSELGYRIACLEQHDYIAENVLKLDADSLWSTVSRSSFKLCFYELDEENEQIILSDGSVTLKIPCPVELQQFKISGYGVIKNVWLKFNSFAYTHCEFNKDDLSALLNLMNKLMIHISIVRRIDDIVQDILDKKKKLFI